MEYTKDSLIDFSMVQNLIDLGGDDGKEFLKEIIDLYVEQYPELFNSIKSSSLKMKIFRCISLHML
ncbi:MAG: hypothetical protein NTU73_13915 [Ignavibacteriae bacterium]|nr:hypothetical protein [Ignavibacteriota bacterium]